MLEPIVLDRFEYKLPKDMFTVSKKSIGFKYKLKHSNVEFDSEDKILKFIDDTLEERKRYQQLLKTLSVKELSKLFSDIILLGLSPKQIKEYEAVEQFVYEVVKDNDYYDVRETFNELWEVKDYIADQLGLSFLGDFNLMSTKDEVVVHSRY